MIPGIYIVYYTTFSVFSILLWYCYCSRERAMHLPPSKKQRTSINFIYNERLNKIQRTKRLFVITRIWQSAPNIISYSIAFNTMLRSRTLFASLRGSMKVGTPMVQRGLQGLVVGVPKESDPDEFRVALTPANIIKLKKAGASVLVQSNAGEGSGFTDADYQKAGMKMIPFQASYRSNPVHYCFT